MQNPNRQSCERKHGTKWNNKAKWQRTARQRERERTREQESVVKAAKYVFAADSVTRTHVNAISEINLYPTN